MSSEMDIDSLTEQLMEKMEKTVKHMKNDFAGYRTGKASPALVENININYYGTSTRLKELAGITTPEPRLLVIQPYDPNSIGEIEKAINNSNIGINPVNDGKILRLPIPELSEERRQTLVKQANQRAEEAKVAIRNIRREGKDVAKKAQKENKITEDDLDSILNEIQDITNESIEEIDKVLKSKEEELKNI